jgi:hypothetical protein
MASKRLLKGDQKGVSSFSPLITFLALRPLRQVLIKVDNGLLSRGSPVRVWPGAPLPSKPIKSKEVTELFTPGFTPIICFFVRWSGMTRLWLSLSFLSRFNYLSELHQLCMGRESRAVIKMRNTRLGRTVGRQALMKCNWLRERVGIRRPVLPTARFFV